MSLVWQAVRDQIRKMVVGGPVSAEDKAQVDAVSDSDAEEDLISQELETMQAR